MICGGCVAAGGSSAVGLAVVPAVLLIGLTPGALDACAKIGADTGANTNSRRSTADRHGMMQEIYQFSLSDSAIQACCIELSIEYERSFPDSQNESEMRHSIPKAGSAYARASHVRDNVRCLRRTPS